MTIGENIKYYRTLRKITQKELAELSGVNPCTISRYELGNSTPNRETIVKIAKALNVTETDILNDFKSIRYEELTNLEFAKLVAQFCKDNNLSIMRKQKSEQQ